MTAQPLPLEMLDQLVSPVCGMLTSAQRVIRQRCFPDLKVWRGTLAAGLDYTRPDNITRLRATERTRVSGAGYNEAEALWSLVGEAVERYAATTFGAVPVLRSAVSNLTVRHLNPLDVIGATDDVRYDERVLKFSPDLAIPWLQGKDAATAEPVLVPALLCLLRMTATNPQEMFTVPVSTGLAAGPNWNAAALSGLLEVVERDAFALHWLMRRPPLRLTGIDRLAVELPLQARSLLDPHFPVRVELFVLDNALGLPCVLARMRAGRADAGFALGAAASLTWSDAIAKAIREAGHVWLSYAYRWSPGTMPLALEQIRTFVDHGRYYFEPDNAKSIDWFFSSSVEAVPEAETHPSSIDFDTCVARLSAEGYEVLVVDLTPPEIAQLGLSVVRVLVPRLQPLTCGVQRVFRDRRRIDSLAAARGWPVCTSLNPLPHPFA
jgi:ribosomal protein S12 methylthiotransferase accessory factor